MKTYLLLDVILILSFLPHLLNLCSLLFSLLFIHCLLPCQADKMGQLESQKGIYREEWEEQ